MFASDVRFEVSFALVEAVLFRFADDDAKLDETPLRRSNCTIRISTAEVSHGVSDRCSQPEDRLPSVRELSRALVVNPKTIARVYTELERENVLNTRPGLGVFVAAPSSDLTRKSRRDRSQELLDTLLTDAVHLGLTHDDVQQAIVDRMKKFQWPESQRCRRDCHEAAHKVLQRVPSRQRLEPVDSSRIRLWTVGAKRSREINNDQDVDRDGASGFRSDRTAR